MGDPSGRKAAGRGLGTAPQGEARPWIGVHFVCSNQYVRVHRKVDGSAYLARCPSCGRQVRFRVGPGGTESRFFEVSC